MVTEQLYWRKIIRGCFHFIWLWLLIAIVKRCTERRSLQLHRTSLTDVNLIYHKHFWTKRQAYIPHYPSFIWATRYSPGDYHRRTVNCETQIHVIFCAIWYYFYTFKKHEKHPWRSVTFSKINGCFLRF